MNLKYKRDVEVVIFDGRGKEYLGKIKDITRNLVVIEIVKTMDSRIETPFSITLYQAIPKKTKMDFIVEKAVELGIDTIVPIITERTIPRFKQIGHNKIERWKRIAKAASKQCWRANLPEVRDVLDFSSALVESKKKRIGSFCRP